MDSAGVPHLDFVTVPLPEPVDLLSILPDRNVMSWVRDGDGVVAWGESARLETGGQERFSRAQRWWSQVCEAAHVTDEVQASGSGPLAFASFTFADGPGTSAITVPQVVVGRRHDKSWLTLVGDATPPTPGDAAPPRQPGTVRELPGSIPGPQWREAVAQAIGRVSAGGLDKVVLARDVVLEAHAGFDARTVLSRLADDYPECWTFCVDGLLGATPEMLVRRSGHRVASRVLAGTVRRSTDSSADDRLADALLRSDKDLVEHRYAVESVAAALARHCTDLEVPDAPGLLVLANVQHLVTDVQGLLADESSAIALAASLHPTAAVCGTPTERAGAVIAQLEGMDRGRYAGPVGWVDANGDGEFGIALRCGSLEDDGRRMRLYAGCGIVAGSTPDSEWAESEAKFAAMRHAAG